MNGGDPFEAKVPGDLLENHEKFGRFLTVRCVLAMILALVPAIMVFLILQTLHMAWLGVFLVIAFEAAAYVLTMKKRDIVRHRNRGGGRYIYVVLWDLFKFSKRKCLYIKGYERMQKGGAKK